jgi:hypothetical protein
MQVLDCFVAALLAMTKVLHDETFYRWRSGVTFSSAASLSS